MSRRDDDRGPAPSPASPSMLGRAQLSAAVRFGPFELDRETGELRRNASRLRLTGQAIDVLLVLVANAGRLVTRQELQQRLWPGVGYGDFEHGLNAAVSRLRETLGDSAAEPRYIETVPRRGYRFIAPVHGEDPVVVAAPAPPAAAPAPAAAPRASAVRMTDPPVARPRARWPWMLAAAGAFVIAVAVASQLPRLAAKPAPSWNASPVSTYPGFQLAPRLSPDGQYLAFFWSGPVAPPDGLRLYQKGLRLYVKAIGTEEPLALSDIGYGAPAWSPDGRFIAYSLASITDSGIYVVPAFGGPSRRVARVGDLLPEVDWSPGGRLIAFAKIPAPGQPPRVHYLDMTTSEHAPVPLPPCTGGCRGDSKPVFSPDGKWLAVHRGYAASFTIFVVPVAGGRPRRVATVDGDFGGMDWTSEGDALVFARRDEWWDEPGAEMMRLRIDDGHIEPLGLRGFSPSHARRAPRLTFTQRSRTVNLWRRDLTRPEEPPALLVISSRVQQAGRYSPDGSRIVFESNRSGDNEIWMCAADGSQAVQLTDRKTLSGSPSWSPDGRKIVYDTLSADGAQHLELLDLDSGRRARVRVEGRNAGMPSFSPDGAHLYFSDSDLGRDPHPPTQVWRVAASGGKANQVSRQGGSFPQHPAGSDFVYFAKPASADGTAIWRARPDGSDEGPVPGLPPLALAGGDWTATADGIYFVDSDVVHPELKRFTFATRSIQLIGRLPYPRAPWQPTLSLSPNGRHLLYSQTDAYSSDVLLVDGFD